jgi:BirA family biotin operon repressor/biotin-[acetyl-CoA-carboxylase] ligase
MATGMLGGGIRAWHRITRWQGSHRLDKRRGMKTAERALKSGKGRHASRPAGDRLSADDVLPLAGTRMLGHGLYRYLETTGSTNDDARAMGAAGAPHGSLVVAETQTCGRGRHDRIWVSPPATGIYATLLLRPGLPPEQTPLISIAAAVAVAEAVRQTTGLVPAIKWPNDLLVNTRKVAGILTEASTTASTVEFVLTGIGINVNTPVDALPVRPLFPATSLAVETGGPVSRAALLAALLGRFEYWLDGLRNGACAALTARWMDYACTTGRAVAVKDMPGEVSGIVRGIAPDGALLLQTGDGRIVRILSGDLRFC